MEEKRDLKQESAAEEERYIRKVWMVIDQGYCFWRILKKRYKNVPILFRIFQKLALHFMLLCGRL